MTFFVFLLSLLIILIVLTVVTTIIKVSLFVTTKYNYETYLLIVPAILYILLWCGLLTLWFVLSNNNIEGGLLNLIYNSILDTNFNILYFKTPLLIFIGCSLAAILLQPFTFLAVNIPYNKIRIAIQSVFRKLKVWFITKVLKKDLKPSLMPTYEIKLKEKWVKLKYLNSLISSIFCYASIFIIVAGLLFTGNILSKKILNIIDTPNEETEQIQENQTTEQVENNI